MHINRQHRFIEPYDELALLLNEKANMLYQKLLVLDIQDTEIDDFGKHYFSSHHTGKRLFFSVQSSADIIYHAVKQNNKPVAETAFMDYGAGLGTLFLLAGMTGFKKVYFNDYFPQWAGYARIICDKLDITISDYVSGNIDEVIAYCKKQEAFIDIIASRNVVEHIYGLRSFYSKLYNSGITSICYSTTTANYHNIAMRLKHYWYHKKVERDSYKKHREELIKELSPGINETDTAALVELTRGRAFIDFSSTVELYLSKKNVEPVEFLSTNTCDCRTGVWAEHLITRDNYLDIIQKTGFKVAYTAGFWDTHYKYAIVNLVTGILNVIIKMVGKKGYWFSPFVNIVAYKK